ncbi:MAG: MCP four helix bundle domain-containing protein, partial [Rhodospirillales bacterium]|nr:MCP four helix bundle domain-containing protein [Rhodospirillales bacterium]
MGNLNIGARLMAGFGAVIVVTLVLGGLALRDIEILSELTVKLYRHPMTVSVEAVEAKADIIAMHRGMKDVVLAPDSAALDAAVKAVADYEASALKHLAVVRERFLGGQAEVDQTLKALDGWTSIRTEVIAFMREGKRVEAAAITREKGAKQVAMISSQMESIITFARNKANQFMTEAESQRDSATMVMAATLAALAVFSLAISVLITRGITKPLAAISSELGIIAGSRDLTQVIVSGCRDEIGTIAASINALLAAMREALGGIGANT